LKSSTTNSKLGEKIEILSGPAVTIDRTLKDFSLVKEKVDSCVDSTGPSIILSTPPVKDAFLDLKKRGIKTRYITEITKENLPYCKKLMELVGEVRHLDNVKGNFGLTEFSYIGTATAEDSKPLSEMLLSTVKSFNAQQQYFFEMLWNKAIPAWERIKEIEEGAERQTIETIFGSENVLARVTDLLNSAQNQILFILSIDIPSSLGTEILDSVTKLALERKKDFEIKILIPSKHKQEYKPVLRGINRLKNTQKHNKIEIRYLEASIQLSLSMIVIDQIKFMSFDLKNNSNNQIESQRKLNSNCVIDGGEIATKFRTRAENENILKVAENTIDHGTYTNSIPTAKSYTLIFETLWHQLDLYKQIMQVCDYLRSRDMAIQEFVNITAHEISNPLQTIISLSDLLTFQVGKDNVRLNNLGGENKELMDTLLANATKLYQLSKDILDTSRLEHGSLSLEKEICDIVKLIETIIKGYRNNINRKVPIEFEILLNDKNQKKIRRNHIGSLKKMKSSDLSFSMIMIDQHRITQVISNLLDNAIKFTDEGKITITLESTKDLAHLLIKIVDTGSGLNPSILKKLFTRFASTSKKGTGLGLYICKCIVELHDGKIWAENNKGGPGSTFAFTLPTNY
jgi:nitrogen-specific signal transduction histidine kinase